MKKSNVIITVILVAASLFLLWLWYYLGLSQVDQPLDLLVSAGWWIVVAAGIVLVVKLEQRRRRQIRTLYAADGAYFNSEVGLRAVGQGVQPVQAMATTLSNLEYGFHRATEPDLKNQNDPIEFRWIVRTDVYKPGLPGEDASAASVSQPNGEGAVAAVAQQDGAEAAASQGQDGCKETWEGEVVDVRTGESTKFSNRQELAVLIA